jgi:hypothetical protein
VSFLSQAERKIKRARFVIIESCFI